MSSAPLPEHDLEYRRRLVQLERDEILLARMKQKEGFLSIHWKSIVSGSVSLIAAVFGVSQWVMTENRQALEHRLKQAETIEKFVPLLADRSTRDGALFVLAEFVDKQHVLALADRFKAKGALEELAAGPKSSLQLEAQTAVRSFNDEIQKLVAAMYAADADTRKNATARLIRNWRNDSGIVDAIPKQAEQRIADKNGTINALVALQSVDPAVLASSRTAIAEFLDRAQANGEMSKRYADDVRSRLTVSAPKS